MNNHAIIYSLLIKHEKVTKAMREARKFGMNKNSFIETREKHGIKNWKKSREKYLNSNRAEDESETELDDKEKIFSPYSPCSPFWTQSSPKWTQSNPKWTQSSPKWTQSNRKWTQSSPKWTQSSPKLTWTWKDERKDSGISEIIMNAECDDEDAYIHSLPIDVNDDDNNNHNIDDDDEYSLNILDKIDDNFLYNNENETDDTIFERFLDVIRNQKVNC